MLNQFINKRKFNESTKKFFENGLMKKLYETEEFVLCNYANQCYLLFPHRFFDYGLVVDKTNLALCIENYGAILEVYANATDEEYKRNTCVVNDKLFEHAKKTKLRTDKEGPSQFVDLELEKQIEDALSVTGRRK